jgi:hypothetical protein
VALRGPQADFRGLVGRNKRFRPALANGPRGFLMFRSWVAAIWIGLILVAQGSLGQSAESSRWKEKISVDRISDEKIVTMTNVAARPIHQFGRNVSATLVMQCLSAGSGTKYVGVAVVFSERVTIDSIGARYRIDNDTPQLKMASLVNNGTGLAIGWDSLVARLPASSRLRVEFELPWAGNAVVEFNTAGAQKALARVPCSPSKD